MLLAYLLLIKIMTTLVAYQWSINACAARWIDVAATRLLIHKLVLAGAIIVCAVISLFCFSSPHVLVPQFDSNYNLDIWLLMYVASKYVRNHGIFLELSMKSFLYL